VNRKASCIAGKIIYHLADIENCEDNACAGVAFGREMIVGRVVVESVNRAHERAIIAWYSEKVSEVGFVTENLLTDHS
jgi:hypothetical protein